MLLRRIYALIASSMRLDAVWTLLVAGRIILVTSFRVSINTSRSIENSVPVVENA